MQSARGGVDVPLKPVKRTAGLQLAAVSFAEGVPYDSSGLMTPLGANAALALPPAVRQRALHREKERVRKGEREREIYST